MPVLTVSFLLSGLLAVGYAQWGWGVGEGNLPARFPAASMPDRDFAFCKLMYDQVRYEQLGMGWSTDYPYAGINLMHRLKDLTTVRVSADRHGEPNHWVVRLTDDALFNCPFVMAADVGTIGMSGEEAARLREYLLKGGFLWVDDFWGPRAWEHWVSEIGRALPPSQYPIRDVPLDHPVFRTLTHVEKVPQITSIQFLVPLRRTDDIRARPRQRRGALPRDHRRARTFPRRDDAQHGRRRRLGA